MKEERKKQFSSEEKTDQKQNYEKNQTKQGVSWLQIHGCAQQTLWPSELREM